MDIAYKSFIWIKSIFHSNSYSYCDNKIVIKHHHHGLSVWIVALNGEP